MFWFWLLAVNTLLPIASLEEVSIGEDAFILTLSEGNATCESKSWEVTVDPDVGVGLNVLIIDLYLDSDQDDYLALSTEPDMSGTTASVAYLAGNLSDINLATPLVQTFYIRLERSEPCNIKENFTIELSRLDEAAPTPEPPPPNPRPPEGIPTEIPIHFSGKTADEFVGLVPSLFSILKEETSEYCLEKQMKCNLTKPANETIFLRDTQSCPASWKDHENCVVTWWAAYVSDPSDEYELNPDHLNELWERIREKENLFTSLGITPYDYPNISAEIAWWMLWIFIAIAIAAIAAYLLWKIEEYRGEVMVGIAEENRQKIFEGVQLRRDIPMRPAKHQKIPAFMEQGADEGSSVASIPQTKKLMFRDRLFPINNPSNSPPPIPSSPAEHIRIPFFDNATFNEEDEEEIYSKKL